jgi:hypothetical protein
MEIRIGVVYTARELTLETDDSVDEVSQRIEDALTKGDSMLWLVDNKGRRVGVPTDKIAFVEIAADAGAHKMGFARS